MDPDSDAAVNRRRKRERERERERATVQSARLGGGKRLSSRSSLKPEMGKITCKMI